MSARGGRGRGRGRGRMTVSEPVGSGQGLENEIPVPPPAGSGEFQDQTGDDAVSQAMLRVLERVAGVGGGAGVRKSVPERLRANGAEFFRGVSGVAPSTAEYWLEATEQIMDDLDLTAEEKLKGIVSLLQDESYKWWLTVRDSVAAEDLTWDYFRAAYQKKYIGASYIDAQRKAFLRLVQGSKFVSEYEAEFLRLSRYARGIVATEHERCVRFEDGLRDELRLLIAPQQEREFAVLVEKAKVAEGVKESVRQGMDRNRHKRSFGSSGSSGNPQKRASQSGPNQSVRDRRGVTIVGNNIGEAAGPVEKHRVRDCPRKLARIQSESQGRTQFRNNGPPPQRGRGNGRGNGSGRGRGAPGRGAGSSEARQPGLVYVARRREEGDAPDVITGTFLIFGSPFTALIDVGSTHSYVASSVVETMDLDSEISSRQMTVISPLGHSVVVDKLFRDVP
ncbi:ATP-dependent zinc metalloprotease FtsH [Gossypium australe]|uniref:ATP-dependent zinc metalloprotease FtsH n=1 Tax=Gossypium australe TaxID=47621 RepID=A0A5B6VXH8_9ROSI|nr:ATP-dependent zinc metalloprotease FtsH [Gossypium australe]